MVMVGMIGAVAAAMLFYVYGREESSRCTSWSLWRWSGVLNVASLYYTRFTSWFTNRQDPPLQQEGIGSAPGINPSKLKDWQYTPNANDVNIIGVCRKGLMRAFEEVWPENYPSAAAMTDFDFGEIHFGVDVRQVRHSTATRRSASACLLRVIRRIFARTTRTPRSSICFWSSGTSRPPPTESPFWRLSFRRRTTRRWRRWSTATTSTALWRRGTTARSTRSIVRFCRRCPSSLPIRIWWPLPLARAAFWRSCRTCWRRTAPRLPRSTSRRRRRPSKTPACRSLSSLLRLSN